MCHIDTLSSCRRFWICTRSSFLSGKSHIQCVILFPRKIIQLLSLDLNCFQQCRSQKVQVDQCAQHPQLQTVARIDKKVKNTQVSIILLTGQLQIYLPCIVNVANHTDLTQTKGLYIPCKIILVFSLNLNCFQRCCLQQGQVDQHAQQLKVKTTTRINAKSTTRR